MANPVAGYTLNRPHSRHVPTVARHELGNPSRRNGGTRWGTKWSCRCGWPLIESMGVSKKAPTAGGRAWAGREYRKHLEAEAPQVELTRAQLSTLAFVHAQPNPVGTTAHDARWRGVVAGNVAAALYRKGLVRYVFARHESLVEATAAGCAVLAQYARWGPPRA